MGFNAHEAAFHCYWNPIQVILIKMRLGALEVFFETRGVLEEALMFVTRMYIILQFRFPAIGLPSQV